MPHPSADLPSALSQADRAAGTTADEAILEKLLQGKAETAFEAEELYLDESLRQVVELAESELSDDEFRDHPLISLLLSHGSRDWEDSLQ
jgi:hypothetical protein